ncbi:MAG TPA: c-type cytochrome [Pseudolabrys sp.]|nr:c-type cytochrome [Pseudolabrys sp.]
MLRMGALTALALAALAASARAETPVERGSYLVNTIMTCGNCHSPKGPPEATAGKDFSGGLTFDEPPFKVTASNITQDKETGIGAWTNDEIKTLLRTGVRPNGVPIAAVMPTGFYGIVTASDMDAIVAYLRTVKPVKNKVADPVYKMSLPRQVFPGAEKPTTEAALNTPVKKGFYLATIGHCMECHTPFGKQGVDFAGSLGKGGRDFPGPWGTSTSRNITPSKTAGIGAWSDDEIKRAITTGVRKDGSRLKPPMGFAYYAKMTDADVAAVIAYLHTVPAKD